MRKAEEEKGVLIEKYYCRICDDEHTVELSKNLIVGHKRYPFSYIFLHGDLKNILTTLYIDKDARIRGVDVNELKDDDIFSKDHVISITRKLIKEIESLRKENNDLREEILNLKKIK